jgi:hypothetical protein
MPKKTVTWVGFVIILAAGVFCSWSLFQARTHFLPAGTRFYLATAGGFLSPVVTIVAIFLWYYFNEKH